MEVLEPVRNDLAFYIPLIWLNIIDCWVYPLNLNLLKSSGHHNHMALTRFPGSGGPRLYGTAGRENQ